MATSDGNRQWYYKDDNGKWNPYDFSSNYLLESAYLSDLKKVNLAPHDASMNYTIDLVAFKQKNNRYGTIRDVKRDETGTMPFQSAIMPLQSATMPLSLPVSVPRIHEKGAKSISPHPSVTTQGKVPYGTILGIPFSTPVLNSPNLPTKSAILSQIDISPHKSAPNSYPIGAIASKSGTIPAKSGTPYQIGSLTPSAQPYLYGGRAICAPQTGTITSLVPVDPIPVPKPRNKKRGKSVLKKPMKYDEFFSKYTETKEKGIPKDETCPICLTPLLEPADVDVPKTSASSNLPKEEVLALKKCSHMFHTICIGTMLDSVSIDKLDDFSISCPICQTIHGVKTGDQPLNGTMTVDHDAFSVPGCEGCGTIVIKYYFSDGVTRTGTRYNGAGFPRICYIPDCPEGRIVLQLLRIAWERRLIFTIGTSVTTGRANCVVWNNIHHKTEPHSNSSGHGFPDPNFLKNIKMELAVQGVTEQDL